jgi:hypothetical protein
MIPLWGGIARGYGSLAKLAQREIEVPQQVRMASIAAENPRTDIIF